MAKAKKKPVKGKYGSKKVPKKRYKNSKIKKEALKFDRLVAEAESVEKVKELFKKHRSPKEQIINFFKRLVGRA